MVFTSTKHWLCLGWWIWNWGRIEPFKLWMRFANTWWSCKPAVLWWWPSTCVHCGFDGSWIRCIANSCSVGANECGYFWHKIQNWLGWPNRIVCPCILLTISAKRHWFWSDVIFYFRTFLMVQYHSEGDQKTCTLRLWLGQLKGSY